MQRCHTYFKQGAHFKQNENKEDLKALLTFLHKKSANISTLSLIPLIGIPETW